MNLTHGREPRASTLDINQPKESPPNPKKASGTGLLLGTDFRHAVEFSRSGRATTPPSRASSMAACPTLRRVRTFPQAGRPAASRPRRRIENHTRVQGALHRGYLGARPAG